MAPGWILGPALQVPEGVPDLLALGHLGQQVPVLVEVGGQAPHLRLVLAQQALRVHRGEVRLELLPAAIRKFKSWKKS